MLRIAGIWADADIFCGHSWVAVGCFRLKKLFSPKFFCFVKNISLQIFPRAMPGSSASLYVASFEFVLSKIK